MANTLVSALDWGPKGRERSELRLFAKALAEMNDRQRKLLLEVAGGMVRGTRSGLK